MNKLLFIITIALTSPAWADQLVPDPPPSPESVGQLWEKHCALCHDSNGQSTKIGARRGSPDNIYDASEDKMADEIFKVLFEGKNKMPSFKKKLTKEQLNNIALHIEYSAMLEKVRRQRKKVEEKIKMIKEEYGVLPECTEPVDGF